MSRGARRPHLSSAPVSIAFFGLFGSGNTGNDASLEAMLMFVRRVRPEARLMCICGEPKRVERDLGLASVPIYGEAPANPVLRKGAYLLHAVRQLRGVDLLIVPGTGILDDFGTGPSGFPLALWTWCLAARLQRVRIAFVSIGAGPIHNPVSRRLMKSAIGWSCYRSYRDQASKDFLAGIGLEVETDPVYPDLAFSLPAPQRQQSRPEAPASVDVGLGVMTYQGWRNDPAPGSRIYLDYVGKISEFAVWLLDSGHRIRLLMGDGTDQRAMGDVLGAIRGLRPSLASGRVRAERCRTLHELMDQIAQTDLVVATRFHNVVSALKLARPTLSIGYAMKNDALMSEVGLKRFCQRIETLDVAHLKSQFRDLQADTAALRCRLTATVGQFRDNLVHQEAVLERYLPASRGGLAPPHCTTPSSALNKKRGDPQMATDEQQHAYATGRRRA